jgi:hypothetical protein
MMRALLPLLLLAFTACHVPRTIGADPYPGSGVGALYDEPLRASLWVDPHTAHASFDLNRAAHVAIFMWQPGRHLTMVHPDVGYQTRQHFTAGSHYLWTRTSQHYATRRSGMARYMGGLQPMAGPVYYMLIASAEPLHVAPFYGTARMGWAHQVSWSHNLYTATELLATQIVPDIERTEWTVAYHMAWQDGGYPLGVPGHLASRYHYLWVQCPGGIIISVPREVLERGLFACPEVEPGEPGTGPDPETRVVDVPRRPLRPDAMQGERADEAEFRTLLERIRAARGQPVEDLAPPPVPAWRMVERGAPTTPPAVRSARPVIRPAVPERTEPEVASRPGAAQPSPWRSPRGVGQGTRVEREPLGARPAREQARPGGEARRPAPRAERPSPQVQRPAPRAERPSPPPAQPRPSPPPPDGDTG